MLIVDVDSIFYFLKKKKQYNRQVENKIKEVCFVFFPLNAWVTPAPNRCRYLFLHGCVIQAIRALK